MNTLIIKCLANLLYERECVIIPEFGAFISKDVPARLDYAVHRLTPPTKEFVFNAQLTTDDGIFANYLSEKHDVTIEKAKSCLHDFAMQSLARIEVEKELILDGIGKLYYINSHDLAFVADVDFCGDSFGLEAFTAQPVYRRETYQTIQENIEVEQKAKNTPVTVFEDFTEEMPQSMTRRSYKWYRAAAYSSMVAMAMVLLGWGAGKSDSRLASWNPLFYSSPSEFVAKHLNDNINAREILVVEPLDRVAYTIPSADCAGEVVLREITAEQLKPVKNVKRYSIIGASLDDIKMAERCVERFKAMGFVNAEIIAGKGAGKYRVEYESVAGKEAALERLEIIRKSYNESAWLLIKK